MKHAHTILLSALSAAALSGCQETDECQQLTGLVKTYEQALQTTEARAALRDRVKARAEKAEAATKARLAELWLDRPEAEVAAELEKRVAELPGAKLERTTRAVASEDGAPGGGETETLWVVELAEKRADVVEKQIDALAAHPPLLRLRTLLQDAKTKTWKVELARATVDQMPMKLDPTPPPPRKDPAAIPEQLGLCGASRLREQIAALEGKIQEAQKAAGETTTLLPAAATWEGLGRRADLLADIEAESRRIARAMFDAVRVAGVRFTALGVEREVVILQVQGGAWERSRIERALPKEIMESIRASEAEQPGTVRLMVANRVEQRMRRPDKAEGGPFPMPAGHDHGHGGHGDH